MKEKLKKILSINYDKKIMEWFKIILIIYSMYLVPSIFYRLISPLHIIKSTHLMSLICNILYLLFLFALYHKSIIKEFVIFKKDIKNNVKIGIKYWIIGLVIMMGSNLIINLLIFNGSIATNEELNREIISKYPIYSIISAVVLAPFIEEVIFRKSFKNAIDNRIIYFIISGLFFGLAHALTEINSVLDLLYIIPYGSLGVVFAISYDKTKTIFTPMLMHIWHNAFTITLLILFNNLL